MANSEHLKILEQGVSIWNSWREDKPLIFPDLSNTELGSMNLQKINLRGCNLKEVNFRGVDLSSAKLSGAYLPRVNLFKANLHRTDLHNADLRSANLVSAFLGEANLNATNLYGANLRNSNLSNVDFAKANLSNADLSGAYLGGAYFSMTNLNESDFSKAIMGWNVFRYTDLSLANGLDRVRHFGPSTIGIETVYLSDAKIPETFLRGAGIPHNFIIYMRSLVGDAIQFYSCFISYSSKDQAFAERLYADLQANNVRCWFAPHDLKIGDRFRVRIDESIRLHDKLLLVLSENSVASQWVEKEVETAMEREAEQNRTVLFPVRLDDSLNKIKVGWPADIRRTRHVGDFTEWKKHDSYKRAFERLLRDLKAEDRR